ncbi:hypothetical protein A2U01_0101256, partial [Trifolium medium]|nr:hypothetical protein [Trifolium medium]
MCCCSYLVDLAVSWVQNAPLLEGNRQ